MREKFAQNSLSFISKYYTYEGKKFDKLYYGLQVLYSLITKTIVVLLLSILFKTFKETMLLILVYTALRCFAFGLHASKNLHCWLITIPIYIFVPLIAKYFTISKVIQYSIIAFSLLSFLLFAPADTHKKPLKNKTKRLIDKIFAVTIAIIISLLFLFSNLNSNYLNILILALLMQAVCINPVTYFIFRQPYNNYKRLKS